MHNIAQDLSGQAEILHALTKTPPFEACIRAAHVSNTEARRPRTKDFTTPHEPRVMQGARQACRLQQQEIGSYHAGGYHEPAAAGTAAGEQPTHNQWVEISWQCSTPGLGAVNPETLKSNLKHGTPTFSGHRPSTGHPRAHFSPVFGRHKDIRALRGIWAAARSLV